MGGRKQWALGEEVLQTDWQGFVVDQVLPVFPDTGSRNAQWPTPPNGAHCVVGTQLQERVAGSWWPTFTVLTQANRPTDFGPIAAGAGETTITGLSASVTVPGSTRYLRVAFDCESVFSDVVNGSAIARIKRGGTQIARYNVLTNGSTVGAGVHMDREFISPSGAQTFTVTIEPIAGNIYASASEMNMFLTVVDLGST